MSEYDPPLEITEWVTDRILHVPSTPYKSKEAIPVGTKLYTIRYGNWPYLYAYRTRIGAENAVECLRLALGGKVVDFDFCDDNPRLVSRIG